MEPCEQRDNIMGIRVTLDELKRGQERFIEVLERIATQGVRIDNLEVSVRDLKNHHETDADELYQRVRSLEQEPGKKGAAIGSIILSCGATAIFTWLVMELAK